MLFQSTHSLRSATAAKWAFNLVPIVSIHALLAECDGQPRNNKPNNDSFNPRTPCGVRLERNKTMNEDEKFQSTHSLRSATALANLDMISMWVSIHALLAECDPLWDDKQHSTWVSIHALLAECDPLVPGRNRRSRGFQSTHSLRSATPHRLPQHKVIHSFNPRTPCGVRRPTDSRNIK